MIRPTIVLALMALAGTVSAGDRTVGLSIWCSAKAADLASTEYALSRGGYERNPLMRNRGVRIGAGLASCVVASEVDHMLRHKRKTRRVVRVIGVVGFAYLAQHNLTRGDR